MLLVLVLLQITAPTAVGGPWLDADEAAGRPLLPCPLAQGRTLPSHPQHLPGSAGGWEWKRQSKESKRGGDKNDEWNQEGE